VTHPSPAVIVPTSNLCLHSSNYQCLCVFRGGVLCSLQTFQTPTELIDLIRIADTMKIETGKHGKSV
jgi:hypothetical protein